MLTLGYHVDCRIQWCFQDKFKLDTTCIIILVIFKIHLQERKNIPGKKKYGKRRQWFASKIAKLKNPHLRYNGF